MTYPHHTVVIDYTNHAGVRRIRCVSPMGIRFDSSQWHPEPQWLLDAYDIDKDDVRIFAVADIHRWSSGPLEPLDPVDVSLAKQLRNSMELNARMKNRLTEYRKVFIAEDDDVVLAIDSILKDEDPACFKGDD